MSHNSSSIEIEQKFYISDLESVKSWLTKNATFKKQNHQIDEYFTPAHNDFLAITYPMIFFRLRDTEGKFSTTYKNWHEIDDNLHHAYCDEFETDVENGEQFRKILLALDFKSRIIVDKVRSSYSYKNFEIDLDQIAELGNFCEIEIEGEYDDITEAQQQVSDLANELGLSDINQGLDTTGGYAMMIFRKNAGR